MKRLDGRLDFTPECLNSHCCLCFECLWLWGMSESARESSDSLQNVMDRRRVSFVRELACELPALQPHLPDLFRMLD